MKWYFCTNEVILKQLLPKIWLVFLWCAVYLKYFRKLEQDDKKKKCQVYLRGKPNYTITGLKMSGSRSYEAMNPNLNQGGQEFLPLPYNM